MNFKKETEIHFYKIFEVCKNSWNYGCGSYLFNGREYKYYKTYYPKQKLLYDIVKNKSEVLEVGVYMGHSILIMLLSNPKLNITAIDIDEKFAAPSIEYLTKIFDNCKINFIKNDSVTAIKNLKNKKFDFFHLDGELNHFKMTSEFLNCLSLVKGDKMTILFNGGKSCRHLISSIKKIFKVESLIKIDGPSQNYLLVINVKDLDSNLIKSFKKNIFFKNILLILVKYINCFFNAFFLLIYRMMPEVGIKFIKKIFFNK
tara:strand:+ start:1829 stop:2602 length:774 start_codon:yes stop_codon:yes gene_type:complete